MKKRMAMLMAFAMVFTSVPINSVIVNAEAEEVQNVEAEYQSDDEIMTKLTEISDVDVDYEEEASEIQEEQLTSAKPAVIMLDETLDHTSDSEGMENEQTNNNENEGKIEEGSDIAAYSDNIKIESITVYTDEAVVTSEETEDESSESESNITWSVENNTLTISGSGQMEDYSSNAIPWGEEEFEYVVVESGITSIGECAFYGIELKTIELPDTLQSIGEYAFAYSEIESIEVPGSVTTIEEAAFNHCTELKSVVLNEGVKTIAYMGFYWCTALESVSLPSTLTSIEEKAFYVSTLPANTVIPEGVTYSSSSFSYTPWLLANGYSGETNDGLNWKITYEYNEEDIESDSVWTDYCSSLFENSTLTIDGTGAMQDYEQYRFIGNVAPWREYTYKYLKIGEDVSRIGSYAFYNSEFTSCEGGAGLTEIGANAFDSSTWLSNQTGDYITFADILIKYNGSDATSVDLSAYKGAAGGVFKGNTTITSVTLPNGMTKIEDYIFYGCTALTSITIPASVTSIGTSAFYRTGLTEVTIPASVTSIGNYAFAYCENLKKVNNLSSAEIGTDVFLNTSYEKYNGTSSDTITWHFDGEDTLTISGTGEMGTTGWRNNLKADIKKVVISEGITSIANYAFSDMSALTEVEIPSTVTWIGNSAFYKTTSLKSIELPEELTTIGANAFYKSAIQTVELPDGLRTIGNAAFESSGLTNITIPKSVTSIGTNAISYCEDLETVTIQTSASFYDSTFYGSNIKTLIIDCDTKTSFTGSGFAYVEYLQLTSKVTSIADYQFWNRTSLKSVSIGENVSSIGSYAFKGCTSLEEIAIPANVKTIGKNAFEDCNALTKVTFEEGLETIERYAFLTCPNLIEVTIPSSVMEIGDYAFYGYYSCYADSEGEKEYYHYGIYDKNFIMHGYFNTEAERYAAKYPRITFDPLGGNLAGCVVSLSATSYTYDGTAKTPTATLKTKYGTEITPISVAYKNNVNVGTATVTVTYTGTKYTPQGATFTETFTIKEAGSNSANATITAEEMEYMYSTLREYGVITSNTSELSDEELYEIIEIFYAYGFEKADAYQMLETYGISYPGAHEHSYTTKVTKATTSANGEITYTCSCGATKTETIAKVSSVTLSATSYTYNGKAKNPTVTVKDSEGNKLTTSSYSVAYSNNVNAGTATAKITLKGNYSGTITKTYTIKAIAASKLTATLSATSYTYNGNTRKPTVTVKYGSTKLVKGTDYTLTYASGRKNVGKYAVKITYKGNYSGSKTLYFKITPKKSAISSLTKGSKKITVKWSKISTQATGYQIRYSTSSSMSNAKTVTVSSYKTTSKVLSGLKAKTKYYVQIRTYKTVNGTKYYSSWSTKKSVTTK